MRVDDWARAGLAAHDRGGLEAAVRDGLAAGDRRTAGLGDAALGQWRFGRGRRPPRRFLQALDGRPLRLASAGRAWTDGETLWLPERLDRAADADGNRRLYTVLAVQLWAQARFGSFNVDPEPELSQWADRERGAGLVRAVRGDAPGSQAGSRNCPAWRATSACLRGPWPAAAARRRRLARPEATAADSLAWVAEQRRVGAGETPIFPHLTGFDPLAARRLRAARIARDSGDAAPGAQHHARGRSAFAWRRRRREHPPLAAEGDAVPADLQAGDLQGLPPDAQAAAQSLAQDLDGMPPEILKPGRPRRLAARGARRKRGAGGRRRRQARCGL
jgi:hypothetical protein